MPPARMTGGSIRFSSTSRLAKMPRSSGQYAIPNRAMRFDASPTSSMPRCRTEPVRWPTMPMIARKVVVLPAPLRPSRVTTSPSPTENCIPCRMCDSPYQACSPSTRNNSSAAPASGMAGPQIGFDNVGIVRHGLVIALGQDPAAGQHRDRLRQVGDHRQIVLDHQHGAVARGGADEAGNAPDILLPEAGHRL